MRKQVQSLTQHNYSLIAVLEGGRWIVCTPPCQFWHDSFCQADTLYLEMWLCCVLPSLFIIAVSVLSICRMLSGIFNNIHLKGNMTQYLKNIHQKTTGKATLQGGEKSLPHFSTEMYIAAPSDIYEVCSLSQS